MPHPRLVRQPAALGALLLACGLSAAQAPAGNSALVSRWRQVENDPALSALALKVGAKTAQFCAACHGQNGVSITPDTPNLAGQLPAYMLTQMELFAQGLRINPFMQGLLKSMSVDEKVNVAMYYHRQSVPPLPASDAATQALVARGQRYYDQVCFRCHGAQGMGDEKIPRIAGQQPTYMALTLKRYRDGSAVRADPLMAENTRLMKDADIEAVAAYVARMK